MKSALKITAAVAALLIVLVLAGIALLPRYLDPAHYKAEIAATAEQHAGRHLRIGGIAFSVLPWPVLTLRDVRLGGSGTDQPLARASRVRLYLHLLPLLERRLDPKAIDLAGLKIELEGSASGAWQALLPPPAAALPALTVQDAAITWHRPRGGRTLRITHLMLATAARVGAAPFAVRTQFDFAGGEYAHSGHLAIEGRLRLDPAAQRYALDGMAVHGALAAPQLPGGKTDFSLTGDVTADPGKPSLALRDLRLTAAGATVNARAEISDFTTAPHYQGTVSIARLDPRSVLTELGVGPVHTADTNALGRLKLAAELEGSTHAIELRAFSMTLDQSTVTGNLTVRDFAHPKAHFDLLLDALDADRYLPPPTTRESSSPGLTALLLQPEILRALDLSGRLRIGRIKLANLTAREVDTSVQARGGLLALEPLSAQLYDGTAKGSLEVDARRDPPAMHLAAKLTKVHAGPLVADVTGRKTLAGRTNLDIDLRASGRQPAALLRSLNGDGHLALTGGAVRGVDLVRLVRVARAKLEGQAPPPTEKNPQTELAELTASVHLADGVARDVDLQGKSPLLRLRGKGMLDLVDQRLDFGLTTTLVATTEKAGGAELTDLVGIPIPLKVQGSLRSPGFEPDMQALEHSRAKQEIDRRAAEPSASQPRGGNHPPPGQGGGSTAKGAGATSGSSEPAGEAGGNVKGSDGNRLPGSTE